MLQQWLSYVIVLLSVIYCSSVSALVNIPSPTTFRFSSTFHSLSAGRLFSNIHTNEVATISINSNNNKKDRQQVVPIILLSGFLGTGKTSTLQHLLENKENLKIGVIVNDFASVNIDHKLLTSTTSISSSDVIELQNGCACCSLQDELIFSVEKLLAGGERPLDAVVVELSGVADPAAVKYNFDQASSTNTNMKISRIVTIIDAASFGTDYLTWDITQDRKDWILPGDDCTGQRHVAELMVEQCEAADIILVNKIDLVESPEQLDIACCVARALNSQATMVPVQFGRVSTWQILGLEEASSITPIQCKQEAEQSVNHANHCIDPTCSDPSHRHDHADHDTSISSYSTTAATEAEACTDPFCTDISHTHSHNHSNKFSPDNLGISSFVYKATRPFNTVRLMKELARWPVPIQDTLDLEILSNPGDHCIVENGNDDDVSPFLGVLRSKGFCWLAPQKWSGYGQDAWRHDTAMYWSHAGRQFGIRTAGQWWGTIPDTKMRHYFVDNPNEYERIVREDFQTIEFQDRRQEIIFIGTQLNQDLIKATLNSCLCTDRELDEYREKLRNFMDTLYSSPIAHSQGGLFDIGGMDHMDMR